MQKSDQTGIRITVERISVTTIRTQNVRPRFYCKVCRKKIKETDATTISQSEPIGLRSLNGEKGIFVDRTSTLPDDEDRNCSTCGTLSPLVSTENPVTPASGVIIIGRLMVDSTGRVRGTEQ